MTTTRIDHTNHDHAATPAGRAACREAANITLSHAVDDYRAVLRLSKSRPGSPAWRKASRDSLRAITAHAALVNLTVDEALIKVQDIARLLPS